MEAAMYRGPDGNEPLFPFVAPLSASGGNSGPRLLAPFQPIPPHASSARSMPPNLIDQLQGSSGAIEPSSNAAAIPLTADTSQFRELIPDLEKDIDAPCAADEELVASASFVCEVGVSGVKNLREKACALCLQFRSPRSSDTSVGSLRRKIKFKVYAGSTIRRGKRALRRDFFTFSLGGDMRARVYCRTPLPGRGSLKWTEEKKEKFLAFEDGMLYSIEVYSKQQNAECILTANYPPGLLVSDSPMERAQDYHGDEASGKHDLRDGDEAWEARKKARHNGNIVDSSLILVPDLAAKASKACVGFRVASYSFKCPMIAGPKNLRQRATTFDVIIKNAGDDEAPAVQELRHLKFKIYADSTIRRGKKWLRRNDFVFRIGSGRVVNVFCKTPLGSRGSLKWTVEKQEHFLAFECGLEYVIQVFSKSRSDDARIYRVPNDDGQERVIEWRDELHPERPTETQTRSSNNKNVNSSWRMEPMIWNMSLNTAFQFLVTVTAPPGKLPARPVVVFHAKDKKVEVQPFQYDMRDKCSMLVAVPRLFSEEKAQQATMQGVKFSRQVATNVLDESGRTVWTTTFTYEVGADFELDDSSASTDPATLM